MYSVVESELNSVAKLLADANLKAYYRFNSGALTTDEKATYTLTNNNSVSEGTGKFGIGANFATSGLKYFSLNNNMGLTNSSAQSFSCWIKLNAEISTGSWEIINRRYGTTSNGSIKIIYEYNSGTRRLNFYRAYGAITQPNYYNITLGTTNWYHLVITYDGTTIKGYVNGILAVSGTASGSQADGYDNYLYIGETGENVSMIIDDLSFWGKVLDPDEIKLLAGYTTPATEVAKSWLASHTNLKLHFKFDEISGTTATDSSGNSHDGTASAASIIANNIGGIFNNKGVFVAASSNIITVTDHADLKPTGNFTVGMWIKTTGPAAGNTYFVFTSTRRTSNVTGILLQIRNDGVDTYLELISGRNTGSIFETDYQAAKVISTTVINGNWHFVVGTWNGSYLKLFLDGVLVAATAWTYAPVYDATNHVKIGCRVNNTTNEGFFNGSIDDLFLLNGTALNAEQVRELYEGRKPGELYPTTGLVGLWHLNGNSQDYSGNGNNGTDTNITYSNANGKLKCGSLFTRTSNSKIVVGNAASLQINKPLSVLSWVKTSYKAITQTIYSNGSKWSIGISSSTGYPFIYTDGLIVKNATKDITDGLWHLIAFVDESNTSHKMYIDGRLYLNETTNDTTDLTSTSNKTIGATLIPNEFFDGAIDEVAIFNRALSETEIRKIYLKSIGRLQ